MLLDIVLIVSCFFAGGLAGFYTKAYIDEKKFDRFLTSLSEETEQARILLDQAS